MSCFTLKFHPNDDEIVSFQQFYWFSNCSSIVEVELKSSVLANAGFVYLEGIQAGFT